VVQEQGFSYRHPLAVFSKIRRVIWGLSVEDGLRAYARMLNTLDIEAFAPLLADDFQYASHMVLDEMTSKGEFLEYMTEKLKTMSSSNARPFAEMGHLSTYPFGPCVVVAQGNKQNLVCTVVAQVRGRKVSRLDVCMVPPPSTVMRSGDYPT
jgi:hypothetical protein